MQDVDTFVRAAAKVPWPRWGGVSASFLLLSRFESAASWSALARVFAAMTMLVLIPFLADLLHRRFVGRCAD